MKVILLRDVPKVGKKYEVKDVADGYAMNYLVRQKFAEPATDTRVAAIAATCKTNAAEDRVQADLLEKNIETLAGKTIIVSAKANEQGHLFQGIHQDRILSAIEEQLKISLPGTVVNLEHPIKECGEHEVRLLGQNENKERAFTVSIMSE